eukprot:TRINITY_DN67424_c0_g1_i1.p1 TRINITY_DN67424_c0_g1~~TRINITY_DN67424_c0_g1_i1.p1  ORF type:complete len:556 (+),score=69.04 TRINITY_DN67424_c0_g1_i1:69-1736(+)
MAEAVEPPLAAETAGWSVVGKAGTCMVGSPGGVADVLGDSALDDSDDDDSITSKRSPSLVTLTPRETPRKPPSSPPPATAPGRDTALDATGTATTVAANKSAVPAAPTFVPTSSQPLLATSPPPPVPSKVEGSPARVVPPPPPTVTSAATSPCISSTSSVQPAPPRGDPPASKSTAVTGKAVAPPPKPPNGSPGEKSQAPPPPIAVATSGGGIAAPSPWHKWEKELPKLDERSGQVLRVWCGVWNLHGKRAQGDINSWLPTEPGHHVYVVGTCESERSIEKSMISDSKARWEGQVAGHLGEDYLMAGAANMCAIHVMVFIHRFLWKYSWDIRTGNIATGFANVMGNKGGTQVGFRVGHTSLLFMNAHLASSEKKMKERTQNLTRIMAENPQKRSKGGAGIHEEYDRVFFMGDLNPRVAAPRHEVDNWLANKEYAVCLARDQLLPLLNSDPSQDKHAGLWPLFDEAGINFPPTYKFDHDSDIYDSGKKQRVPSWTDRILWKRDAQIRSVAYGCIPELKCSDHRPIFAQFEVTVDLENWEGPEQGSGKGDSRACSTQ